MQTTGTLEEINIDYKTGKPKISFLIDGRDKLSDIEQLKGLKLKIEAKKYIKKRTTNANNYFWKLLQELCELAEIDTVEEYRRRVKELGIFRRFKIEAENIKTFEKMWNAQGIAWFCEIADTTYIENTEFKIINAYYGSSSFNSKLFLFAHLVYILYNISAQSCDSVPPAPGCIVTIALLLSYFPESIAETSSFSTSFSSFFVFFNNSFANSSSFSIARSSDNSIKF